MWAERARVRFTVAAGAAAMAALGYGFVSTRRPPATDAALPSRTSTAEILASAAISASPPSLSRASATPAFERERSREEVTPVSELRALLARAPEQALAAARANNTISPDDPDAPERGYIVVRALDDLKRHHEAQAEARALVQRYPGNPFAEDVERHVLLYPLDQPSREAQEAAAKQAAARPSN